MSMRRYFVLGALFMLSLLICLSPACALGETQAPNNVIEPMVVGTYSGSSVLPLFQNGGMPSAEILHAKVDSALKAYIVSQLEAYSESIYIYSYGINKDDVFNQYTAIINSRPDLFYVDGNLSWSYTTDFIVTTISPQYLYAADEIPAMKANYNAELSRIAAYASSAATPLGKALLVNDYFCINYEYDESYTIYDSYQLFTKKTGVCQAYMLGYRAAMNMLNIPCKTVTSKAMNHTWNMVYIDGSWYHVDVTWNDPIPNAPYRARHYYFLRSDGNFPGHSSWDAEETASSARFDSFFWTNINYALPVYGSKIYYVDEGSNAKSRSVMSWDQSDLSTVTLHSFDARWYNFGTSSYYSGYFGLMGLYGSCICFSTPTQVLSINTDGSDVNTLYAPDTSTGYMNLGYVYNGVIRYAISANPYAAGAAYSYTIQQVNAAAIFLNADELALAPQGGAQLAYTLSPIYASDTVVWTSSAPAVATVSDTGVVNALALGEATITATGAAASASCAVKVVSLAASPARLILKPAESHALKVSTGSAATVSYNWTSSNLDVASVDANGVITAVANGTAAITATAKLNDKLTATCEVLVKQPNELVLPQSLTGISAGAFGGAAMERVEAGDSLISIGGKAFASCEALRMVTLGASVESIADDAFEGCADLLFICPTGSIAEGFALSHGFAVSDTHP